jgi:hypothetical protein
MQITPTVGTFLVRVTFSGQHSAWCHSFKVKSILRSHRQYNIQSCFQEDKTDKGYSHCFNICLNEGDNMWNQSRNKGGASGALTPGAVHVGVQN